MLPAKREQIADQYISGIQGVDPAKIAAATRIASSSPSTNPIERSFEFAASRCDDLTPLVYRRLHAERPETLTMFRSAGSDLVKGSMLAMTIEAILDFAGPRRGKAG